MTLLQTKDGIKNVDYLDAKTAARVLTPEGWEHFITGKVLRPEDFNDTITASASV